MSDPVTPPTAIVRSRLDRRRRLSLVWAIPIVTVLAGAWLAWHTLAERGSLITITFETASGLIAGQSHVRTKDVDMGVVEHIGLSPDLQRVVVTVRMNREAEPLLTNKAQFWIVKPRFFAGAVVGLETLVSGSYIALQPSGPGGTPERNFTGLETPPVLTSDVPGHTFLLLASRLGNITLGSPISFRGLDVGEVLGWDIANMADSVTIHAFVRAPYDRYVHDSTRFWNASGATVQLSANGLELKLESLRALLLGGIAFETPNPQQGEPISPQNHVFPLYASEQDADAAGFPYKVYFISYFTGSVAGLQAAAPVTLRGITVGQVQSVTLHYDKPSDSVVVAVRYEVEPQRVADLKIPAAADLKATLAALVKRGLRARLDTTSMITGQKDLALEFDPKAPPAELAEHDGVFVLPVEDTGSTDIVTAAGALMARLQAIPFEQIGQNLNQALSGVNGLVNGTQLKESVASLQSTLANAQALTEHLNTASGPLLQRLPEIAAQLDSASQRINALVGSIQTGYGGKSTFNDDTRRLLLQLTDTARSFRILADMLTRHPEALIRGRADEGSR
ncbi:MAG TPA: MlaD family protein [Acetobacteraceae bacterium]|jgi:paraquat-inducible protein B